MQNFLPFHSLTIMFISCNFSGGIDTVPSTVSMRLLALLESLTFSY